jgi:trimeric autotransporter adhesin
VAVDVDGNVFIADFSRIRRVSAATSIITTVAGNGACSFSGDGGAATSAGLCQVTAIAVDADGNMFIADVQNYRIRRVSAVSGIITTIAGNGASGFSGDGGAATSATIDVNSVAVDASGNLFIATSSTNRIRRVSAATGVITTVAGSGMIGFSGDGGEATSASLRGISGVAVDAGGNVFFADQGNHRIRRVSAVSGIITTIAGNGTIGFSGDGTAATSASLFNPLGVAVDAGGNVLFADEANHRIRRVSAATDVITTVAGNGLSGISGDGSAATSASLSSPSGVAVDGGNIIVVEAGTGRIRRISAPTLVMRPPTPSPTASTSPYCPPDLYRALPRTDLVGTLAGTAVSVGESVLLPAEPACRQACCDAAACEGYAFSDEAARQLGAGACYLYVKVTQLVPSSGMASGLLLAAL